MTPARNDKLYKIIATAIFCALIVVLTMTAGMIQIGSLKLTFVLVPVALTGILFGVIPGTIAGFAFGLTVFMQCVTGLEAFGYALFVINPFYTFIATVGRGIFAGLLTALVYKGMSKLVKNMYVKAIVTAIAAPVLNTGIFLIAYSTLFTGHLKELASESGEGIFTFVFVILVGINFIVELATSVILTPPAAKALEKAVIKKG